MDGPGDAMSRTISPKDSVGEDEWWCEWFRCPKCRVTYITRFFAFCPNCGVELRHTDGTGKR